jgi:hypothetical protein
MAQYNFDKKMITKKFIVEISTVDQYGYFEHNYYGDELGGGLWFENNELMDFDGTYVLPEEVADIIKDLGFIIDKNHFCDMDEE